MADELDAIVACLNTKGDVRTKRQRQRLQLFLAERHLEPFSRLNHDQRAQLCKCMWAMKVDNRMKIVSSGEAVETFYAVIKGHVLAVDDAAGAGRERTVGSLKSGDVRTPAPSNLPCSILSILGELIGDCRALQVFGVEALAGRAESRGRPKPTHRYGYRAGDGSGGTAVLAALSRKDYELMIKETAAETAAGLAALIRRRGFGGLGLLPEADLGPLAAALRPVIFRRGQPMVQGGTRPSDLLLIEDGLCLATAPPQPQPAGDGGRAGPA